MYKVGSKCFLAFEVMTAVAGWTDEIVIAFAVLLKSDRELDAHFYANCSIANNAAKQVPTIDT
jgi:hypothetical protein